MMKNPLIYPVLGVIKIYQYAISPMLGPQCRFSPTCSNYCASCLKHHGLVKGGWLGLRRIIKCHPWYRGELIDPVPETVHIFTKPFPFGIKTGTDIQSSDQPTTIKTKPRKNKTA